MPKDADDDGSGEVTFDEFCMLFGIPSASSEPLPGAAAFEEAPDAGSAAAPPRPPPSEDRAPTRAEKEENARLAKKHKVSEGEIQSLRESFWTFDVDASGSIDSGELGQVMAVCVCVCVRARAYVRTCVRACVPVCNSGEVQVMAALGVSTSEEKLQQMIAQVDEGGGGQRQGQAAQQAFVTDM